jgi:hypothetical protein
MNCRYLKAWDIEDAAREFLQWGTFQQVDCLASLDAYTAAAILTRAPESLRKDLLGMLEPFVAANIVQVCCCTHQHCSCTVRLGVHQNVLLHTPTMLVHTPVGGNIVSAQ